MSVTRIFPDDNESGFVIALYIGTFSIRLAFNRHGHGESRRARRRRIASEELAERQRWAEINRLMAAQTMLDRAKGRAA